MDKSLIDQLQDRNPQKRRAATYKMGKSKDTGYVPHLINSYDDPDATVRQNVIEALRLLGTKEANDFLNATTDEKLIIKSNVFHPKAPQIDPSDPTSFIDHLPLDRRGLNTVLDRMDFATPEVRVLLQAKLTKMFGEKALDWWEAIARDREIIASQSITTVAIPAPPPGNLGGRLAVAGAVGLLTGNLNAGVMTSTLGGNLLLNDKIKLPAVCNLCGVNEGTHYKTIIKDVVFSELGMAMGGSTLGKRNVELQVPVCAHCANLAMSPGVSLINYLKIDKDWKITLSVMNSAVANQYINLNPGGLVINLAAPVVPASPVKEISVKPEQGNNLGTIEIHRNPKTTGALQKINVLIDDKQVGALGGNETLKITIPAGAHALRVTTIGMSNAANINVGDGQNLKFLTEFKDPGRSGGGLNLEIVPESPVQPEPGANTGTVEIHRNPKTTGFMHKVKVTIDGKLVGALGGNETIKFEALVGTHALHVEGGGLSKTVNITICDGQYLKFQTEFSDMGLMGGGLKLEPLPPMRG